MTMKFFEKFVPEVTTSEDFNNGVAGMIGDFFGSLFGLASPLFAAFGFIVLLVMIVKASLTRRR